MKEIFIRRHEIPNNLLPPEIVSSGLQRLGSVLKDGAPLRGLSFEEEQKYLPELIGVAANSPEFTKEAKAFWANLTIPVSIDGHKLNVGKKEDGEPVNVRDWVIYQWALRHPHVASSKGDANANFKARFYIHDPDEEVDRKNRRTKLELAAATELTKIISGAKADEQLARLTRVLVAQNPDRLSREEMENMLAEVARRDPQAFLSAVQNKKLELQDLAIRLEEAGVIQKIGHQYRYADETIAASLDEMVAFLDNKQNSRILGEMKAKLEEAQNTVAA